MPPALKLGVALGFVFAVALAPRFWWSFYGGAATALVLAAGMSGIRVWPAVKRLLWLEPFALSVALLALWQPHGGLIFASMVCKSTLCLGCMILLSSTTPFPQLMDALRKLGVPGLLVTTLALMHRYLFVLQEEAQRMRRARQSRTFVGGRLHWWRALSSVIAQLFVRSSERAERIYAAMCARGWKP